MSNETSPSGLGYGIGLHSAAGLSVAIHLEPYPERTIDLHFYRGMLTGTPEPVLGQELRWITPREFASLEFPAADAELIAQLVSGE